MPFVAVYSASKFALHGFFDALRQEYEMQNFGVSVSTFVLGKDPKISFKIMSNFTFSKDVK